MRTSISVRGLTTALVTVALLAGCGSGGGGDSTADSSDTSGTGSQDAAAQETPRTEGDGAEPAADSRVEVAPADLANFSCEQRPNGRWKAKGTVTNSTRKPMTYTMTVVTTADGDQVVGEQVKSVELKPDQSTIIRFGRLHQGASAGCMPHLQREPA